MKVIKEKTAFGTDVILGEEDKFVRFSYGGNLDLYCSIHSKYTNENSDTISNYFNITKENYDVYRLFEQLFDDIENINIFDDDDLIPLYYESEEEKNEYIQRQLEYRERQRDKYRLYNHSNYNELFDTKNRTITWYSDETAHEVANILKIKQEEDMFKLEFYVQPYIDDYDEDFYSPYYIPIRFRNSGSSYSPFNILFMKLYNNLGKIKDIENQNNSEEYLYESKMRLVRKG